MDDISYIQDVYDKSLPFNQNDNEGYFDIPKITQLLLSAQSETLVFIAESSWGQEQIHGLCHLLDVDFSKIKIFLHREFHGPTTSMITYYFIRDCWWQESEVELWLDHLRELKTMVGNDLRSILLGLLNCSFNPPFNLKKFVQSIEALMILKSLIENQKNRLQSAQQLGIKRTTLIEKLKRCSETSNVAEAAKFLVVKSIC